MTQLLLLPSVHTLLAQCGKTWWLHRSGERSWCRLILTHCGKKSDMPCKGCVAQGHSNACFLTMRSAPRGVVLDVKAYRVACVMQQLSSDSMTPLSHTIVSCLLLHFVKHNFVTYNFVAHNFVANTLPHTHCHTQLCHIQLCHAHTTLSHTINILIVCDKVVCA